MRICRSCSQELPDEAFHRKLNGRVARCANCVNSARRASRIADPERARALDRARDREKRRVNDRAYHARNRQARNETCAAYAARNRERLREYHRARYSANRERDLAKSERWRLAHPVESREHRRLASARRRARLRGLPAEAFTVADVWTRDVVDGVAICYLCELPVALDVAHIEHLIPVAATPENLSVFNLSNPGTVLANVTLAHASCNKSKGGSIDPRAVALYRAQTSLASLNRSFR